MSTSASSVPAPWERALHRVAREDDIPADRPHGATVAGLDIVLVRAGRGELRAYEGHCPHQGTLLSEGELEGAELVCRAHGWRFDCETGERRGGAACLRSYPLKIRDGEVWIDLGDGGPTAGDARRSKPPRALDELPRPRALPIVGNLHQLPVPRVHLVLEAWARELGTPYVFRLAHRTGVVFADAAVADAVLKRRPDPFRRMGILAPLLAELGASGVFIAEGDAWRRQRRLVMQTLSNRNTRAVYPTLRRVAERLRGQWASAARRGRPRDIVADLMRFTVDVTTSLVFSTDMNTVEGGDDVLQRHLAHIMPQLARRVFSPFPYWRHARLPADRRLDRALAEVRKIQDSMVRAARARLAALPIGERQPKDLLEAMLLAVDEDGAPFDDETIHGNMLTMLVAGEDTTAYTIAWAIHFLCDRPDVVARAREEIDAVLGGATSPADFESAARLEYLDGITNESMRLKPVAAAMVFDPCEDVVVGEVAVPKGTSIFLLPRLPALDPRNFEDPDVFWPERWLPDRPADHAHAAHAHVPFGSGPRICPGRSLALLEARLVLAMLLKNFDLQRAGTAADVREKFSFTVGPADLRVRLVPRAPGGRGG